MTEQNLDYICAKYGQEMGKNGEHSMIQKALGVLQEDGLFAFSVYLETQNQSISNEIQKESKCLLNEIDLPKPSRNTLREDILEITQDLDDTFLAKNLLERALIYARYRAKATE